MQNARLNYSSLNSVTMIGAKAGAADFKNVNLDSANLAMADLSNSDFKGSSMNGVLEQGTIYDGANLGRNK